MRTCREESFCANPLWRGDGDGNGNGYGEADFFSGEGSGMGYGHRNGDGYGGGYDAEYSRDIPYLYLDQDG